MSVGPYGEDRPCYVDLLTSNNVRDATTMDSPMVRNAISTHPSREPPSSGGFPVCPILPTHCVTMCQDPSRIGRIWECSSGYRAARMLPVAGVPEIARIPEVLQLSAYPHPGNRMNLIAPVIEGGRTKKVCGRCTWGHAAPAQRYRCSVDLPPVCHHLG